MWLHGANFLATSQSPAVLRLARQLAALQQRIFERLPDQCPQRDCRCVDRVLVRTK